MSKTSDPTLFEKQKDCHQGEGRDVFKAAWAVQYMGLTIYSTFHQLDTYWAHVFDKQIQKVIVWIILIVPSFALV